MITGLPPRISNFVLMVLPMTPSNFGSASGRAVWSGLLLCALWALTERAQREAGGKCELVCCFHGLLSFWTVGDP